MEDALVYSISLIIFGCAAIFSAWWLIGIQPSNLTVREKIARSILPGMVFAVADLLWCIPHSKPLLPVSLHVYLIPAVIASAILAYLYLDYLFSRAIGGFFILLAYFFLHESFTLHTPWAPAFSVFCFAMGIVGIFFAGKPHLLRDFIRQAATSPKIKWGSAITVLVFGLFCLMIGIMHFTGKGI